MYSNVTLLACLYIKKKTQNCIQIEKICNPQVSKKENVVLKKKNTFKKNPSNPPSALPLYMKITYYLRRRKTITRK